MRNLMVTMLLSLAFSFTTNAQNIVKGIVVDNDSNKPLQGVTVSVKEKNVTAVTNSNGAFMLQGLPNGKQMVVVSMDGFETQNFPVNLSGRTVDLGTILLYTDDFSEEEDLSTIVISDDELSGDTSAADNISGLLQSSRDVYLRSAAFEWSPSFYRIRGLDSENGKVLINGIEMNKLYNGRPQWGNWGGLNDVMRNQEFSNFLTPSAYTFGGALGSTNINVRASEARPGGRISYASSNRSYEHRLMATYASGMLEDGWSFAFSASRRMADEGFVNGTSYNAYSMFGAIEKKFNENHSLNFTTIYAFNKRGKNAPNTQEVYDIKGTKYNPYWGYQDGKIRNSRLKRIEEPIVMLNHYWTISENTTLNTNVAYQFGELGNSRIDYNGTRLLSDGTFVGGGSNPDPTYYQKLPSYAIRNGNNNAYGLLTAFQQDGQLNWNSLYEANSLGSQSTNSKYILYEDRSDDKQFTANTILNTDVTENITVNGKLQYTRLKSNNFAEVLDLLGGQGYLDIDAYGDNIDLAQNNLLNPNRIVGVGDQFKYNYELNSDVMNAFLQGQFKFNKVDFYVAGDVSKTSHQRNGLYQNGSFANNSLGKSEKLDFTNFSGKAGVTYKITGRHLLDFNGGYVTKAPSLRNSFSNPRENNNVVTNLESEKIIVADASYIFRSPIIQAKVTGYYNDIKDATEISFFFADGIGGDGSEFVQEVLTGIDKRHFGAELGIEIQATPTLKFKGAANIGQYTYTNNPNIYLTSDNTNFSFESTTAFLKDYKVASGPQKAYSVGFEYRDPEYWWVGVTGNFLDDAYVDISPLKRTSNFALDSDGLPLNDYDPVIAKKLLEQEKFDNYFTLNAIGGKSWKVGDKKYIGIFASISNILDKEYKTGGFEQARTANYRVLKADADLDTPVFGNKYWYGRGTTYFVNINYRF